MALLLLLIFEILLLWPRYAKSDSNADSKRLYDDLINGYNSLIRPVGNNSDRLTVKMGLKLSQLIDVNIKNQIMTTNVWVEQEWNDYKLRWEPEEYGGVSKLHVPAEQIWLPDIVLYNKSPAKCELRSVIRFLHAVGSNAAKTHKRMSKAYREAFVSDSNVRKWCRNFDAGRTDVHDAGGHGRKSVSTDDLVQRVDQAIRGNRCVNEEMLDLMFDVSYEIRAFSSEFCLGGVNEELLGLMFDASYRIPAFSTSEYWFSDVNEALQGMMFGVTVGISSFSCHGCWFSSSNIFAFIAGHNRKSLSRMSFQSMFIGSWSDWISLGSSVSLDGVSFGLIYPYLYIISCVLLFRIFFKIEDSDIRNSFLLQVDLKHKYQTVDSDKIPMGIDLSEFYLSVEWDIMAVPAVRTEKFYSCCEEPYPDITFNITLRRKTLFYTVNLIIPCVFISFLSILVFYLPSDSGEKVSLSISIVLSLGVFFLLLSEIIPPTSLTVPLLGKYLLFTMILVSFSVFVTIAVLNVNFRSPSTHKMAPWVRRVFIEMLPKLLCMQRPDNSDLDDPGKSDSNNYHHQHHPHLVDFAEKPGVLDYECGSYSPYPVDELHVGLQPDINGSLDGIKTSPDVERAVLNVRFIAQHMENLDSFSDIESDWQYVAMVLDRLFLWIFTIACVVGTGWIILCAPALYDDKQPIDIMFSKVAPRIRRLLRSD
ncbi:acetylcholine receptor subunit alpha-like 1 [Parasteatoda tepidariorum]|uniref:acetylcholine receptor subunit alpha-like 1 n=1 Tax=Parasteatoda tepidariorum TaxID=114398 RepID=UPI0039BC63AC